MEGKYMKATQLPVYKKLEDSFYKKGYSKGKADNTPINSWNKCDISKNVTIGHYIDGINYGKIDLADVPYEYRTREFFLHTLYCVRKDIIEYVKSHSKEFDKKFFKDHIETDILHCKPNLTVLNICH